jgi:hypothetical protein
MRSLVVVVPQPPGQVGSAGIGAAIGQGIGPFAQQGLDEPLGLAIGLRRVRPGPDVAQAQQAASLAEQAVVFAAGGMTTGSPDVSG